MTFSAEAFGWAAWMFANGPAGATAELWNRAAGPVSVHWHVAGTSGWGQTESRTGGCGATERVNLLEFVETLPEGFEQPVRERGNGFSTGQKQLISFARALAHDPRVLILDEATSSVDTETEFLIRDALTNLVEGRTSIVIAHRLSTIQRADRIFVMHKGQLRESGTHQELLAPRGIYYKLYQLQYKDQEVPIREVSR